MRIRKILFVGILGLCIFNNAVAQKIGEKVYKEISIDGELIGKWCEYLSIDEYNEAGKKNHSKNQWENLFYTYDENGRLISDSDGDVYQYDSKENNIYFKNASRKFEIYYDYDSNGNMIHYKRTDGVENWYEYDKNNNQIHQKTSIGNELYWEYDRNGNKVHEKWIVNGKILKSEKIWSYNNQNKQIYCKETKYDKGNVNSTSEDTYQYDSNGNCSYEKNIYQNQAGTFVTEQEYKYDIAGNLQYRFYKKGNYSCIDFHELEYWDESKTKLKSDKVFRYIK